MSTDNLTTLLEEQTSVNKPLSQADQRAALIEMALSQSEDESDHDELQSQAHKEKQVLDDKDLKYILKQRPEERSIDQIQIIKNHVKDIKVFKEFNQQSSEDQLNELCKNLHLQFLLENKKLFEQGDRGDSYFIILEGSVDILIKVVDEKTGVDYNKKVAILKKGDAFGDLSLLYGAPRNATCHTREDSYFIVMSKVTYDKVIKSHQVEKIHDIAQFYLNFPLFQNLDKITLMYFATKTVPQKLQSKHVVVKQGDDPGRVYFVKAGRLKIIKKVNFRTIPENGYLQFDELIDDPMITELRKGLFQTKLLQLDILEQGDVFCHNSVIQHQPIEYTVITEVPCEVYIINEMDFLTLNKKTLDQFQEYIKPYPTDRELRKMHYETIRWKNYKKNIMETIKLNKQRKGSFNSLLRGDQTAIPKMLDQDYLNMNERTLVYHKNYKANKHIQNSQIPLTSRNPDINPLMKLPLQAIQERRFQINNQSDLFKNHQDPTNNLLITTKNKATFRLSMGSQQDMQKLKLQPIKPLNSFRNEQIQTHRDSTVTLFGQRKKTQPKFEIEEKKNKTIFKFDSNDQQFQIIYNQRNKLAGGALPPLTLKLIKKSQSQQIQLSNFAAQPNINFPNNQLSTGNHQDDMTSNSRHAYNQKVSKKRKFEAYSQEQDQSDIHEMADWINQQFKRLKYNEGIQEEQDSTSQSSILEHTKHDGCEIQLDSLQLNCDFGNREFISANIKESKAELLECDDQQNYYHTREDISLSQFNNSDQVGSTLREELPENQNACQIDLIKVTRTNGHIDIEPYHKMLPFEAYSEKLTQILNLTPNQQHQASSNISKKLYKSRQLLKQSSKQQNFLELSMKKRYEYVQSQSHPLISDFSKFCIEDQGKTFQQDRMSAQQENQLFVFESEKQARKNQESRSCQKTKFCQPNLISQACDQDTTRDCTIIYLR